jgi:tRNA G18 (ribose-2'-O)-methylase SpoU
LADPRLAPYRDLKRSNLTRWSGLFVAEGEKLAVRLLQSNFDVESVLVDEPHLQRLQQQAKVPPELPVFLVPGESVPEIVGFNFHRGVLACGRRKPRLPLAQALTECPKRLTLVVCPDVQNPENLGSILRTSLAFGADAVVLGRDCADPFSRRVLRVSMGAALGVPIVESWDLAGELTMARERWGVQLAATVVDPAAEKLVEAKRPDRLALVFGSEGHGLSPDWLALCDRRLTIPIASGVDSLNVAIAAGIFLHHFQRPAPA